MSGVQEINQVLPLKGFRVVDLTRVYSGPYTTFLMALAGAEVLKIEPPDGESLRKRDGQAGSAVPFALLNANKKALTLNLKADAGKDLLTKLLATADVLVENFRPGVLENIGFGEAVLKKINSTLICGSISGYGQEGPYKNFPAMDLTVQAAGGIISSTGWPEEAPVKAGVAMADISAGVHLYGGIVSALLHRERTGEIIHPKISMLDSLFPTLASNVGLAFSGKDFVERTGNRHAGLALCPYNVYPAADGFVAIICNGDRQWRDLCETLGLNDLIADQRFENMPGRVANMDYIDDRIGTATSVLTRDELFAKLNAARVACGPVRTLPEVLNDPHLLQTGMLQKICHPLYGELVLCHSPLTYSGWSRSQYHPSSSLGSDNRAIYENELGFDLSTLETTGAI